MADNEGYISGDDEKQQRSNSEGMADDTSRSNQDEDLGGQDDNRTRNNDRNEENRGDNDDHDDGVVEKEEDDSEKKKGSSGENIQQDQDKSEGGLDKDRNVNKKRWDGGRNRNDSARRSRRRRSSRSNIDRGDDDNKNKDNDNDDGDKGSRYSERSKNTDRSKDGRTERDRGRGSSGDRDRYSEISRNNDRMKDRNKERSRDISHRYRELDDDSRHSDRSKDNDRLKDRKRDKEIDRDKNRNRYSDRSKDRYGESNRDKGRDRARDRDRSKDNYRESDRDKNRDRVTDADSYRTSDLDRSRDEYRDRYRHRKDTDRHRRRGIDRYRDRDGDSDFSNSRSYRTEDSRRNIEQERSKDRKRDRERERNIGRDRSKELESLGETESDRYGEREEFSDPERVNEWIQEQRKQRGDDRYRELYVGDKDDVDYPMLQRKQPQNDSVTIPHNVDSTQKHTSSTFHGIYDDVEEATPKQKKDWRLILSPSRLLIKLKKLKKFRTNNDDDVHKDNDTIDGKPDPMSKPPEHHANDKTRPDTPASAATKDDDKSKLVYGQDENEERGNWTGRYDFILSLLGTAVGLGNIWRFPYLCYRNGGGAFLFPFLIMMVIIGVPLFFLEAALGQFSSCGAMTCWEFAPFFKGVGVSMVLVSTFTGVYYNMILGWSLHYLFASFTDELPWTTCLNEWNTKDCNQLLPEIECDEKLQSKDLTVGVCRTDKGQEVGIWNMTLFDKSNRKLASASEEYWNHEVLDFSSTIDNFGVPKWDLVLCLLLAWIICFFCLIKGIKTTGKVVYFTAIFPYVVLAILFFRGVTLDNAGEGIKYFITPKFERLGDANVWKDAANQIFFSLSIAGGGLITLSSYNRFHNNILRDSLIVAVGDAFTCVFGGFVIFSFLGYMAGKLDVGIEDVAADGAGLAFVVYPEAVSSLPPAPLWSILFFFMLLTLGLDSQFAMLETVLTGVLDQYPSLRPRKTLVILSICCVLFIIGLPLTCPGGMYLLQIMDNYVGGMSLIILVFVELVAVVFIYGAQRFSMDIQLMIGETRFVFWKITWCILSPITVVFIFIFMFVDYKRSTYGEDYTYPVWADVFGWLITLSIIMCIPANMVFRLIKERDEGSLWERIRALCLPTLYWGPALPKHRKLVDYVSGFRIDPWQDIKPKHAYSNPAFSNNTGDTNNGGIRETPTPSQAAISVSRLSTQSPAVPCATPTNSRRRSREFRFTISRDPDPLRHQRGLSAMNGVTSQQHDLERGQQEEQQQQKHQEGSHVSLEPRERPLGSHYGSSFTIDSLQNRQTIV